MHGNVARYILSCLYPLFTRLTVVLLTFFTCLSGLSAAQARAGGGIWIVVLEGSGVKSNPTLTVPFTVQNPLDQSYGGGSISASITVKVVWSGSGSPTIAPPKSVFVAAYAHALAFGPGAQANANDGFPDAVNITSSGPPSFATGATATGKHILHVPDSVSSPITVGSYTVSATASIWHHGHHFCGGRGHTGCIHHIRDGAELSPHFRPAGPRAALPECSLGDRRYDG